MGRNGVAGLSVYQSANDGQGRLRSTILQINSWGEKGNEQAKEIGGLLRVFAVDGVFGGGAKNGSCADLGLQGDERNEVAEDWVISQRATGGRGRRRRID